MPPTPPTRDDLIRGFLRGRGRPNLNIPGARRRVPKPAPGGVRSGGSWRRPRKPPPRGGRPPAGGYGGPDLPRRANPTLKRF